MIYFKKKTIPPVIYVKTENNIQIIIIILQMKNKCRTSNMIRAWSKWRQDTVFTGLARFEMLLDCVLFPFSKKISPHPFICLPVDVHHSLHINHQSVAPFSPPPGLNLFTFLSFPFLYRESRLIRRSLDLIFIKGLGEGGDLVMTIIFHIWNRDKG